MKKFKENFKRFWSLQKHSNGGFTLVELIVVIAILAILAGIAVPAYSGYVEKANKQADITLFSEVENALTLAYYSDSDFAKVGGYITLTSSEAQASTENAAKAMEAAFGEGWQETAVLKHNWLSSFSGSSYEGREEEIISAIDVLTDSLSGTIATLAGDQFNSYMTSLGVDVSNEAAVSDAAVFYIANQIAEMGESKQNIINGLPAYVSAGDPMEILYGFYSEGMSPVVAAATVYAMAEGMCTELDDDDVTKVFNESIANLQNQTFADQNAAVEAVMNALVATQEKAIEKGYGNKMGEYFTGTQAAADMNAYFDMLTSVAGADTQVKDSFGTENCFSGLNGLVEVVTDGGVVIFLQEYEGTLKVVNTALNTEK